jgi:O-antigen ligase
MEGGKDAFREKLRELAMEKIQADPWVGRGYAVDRRIMALIAATPNHSEKYILQLAQGSAWHNTWLGYAADFGIPASALQAVIYGYIFWIGLRVVRQSPEGSMMKALVLYIVMFTIRDILASHTSGHSSLDAFGRWWMYGLMISIALRVGREDRCPPPPDTREIEFSTSNRPRLRSAVRQAAIARKPVR